MEKVVEKFHKFLRDTLCEDLGKIKCTQCTEYLEYSYGDVTYRVFTVPHKIGSTSMGSTCGVVADKDSTLYYYNIKYEPSDTVAAGIYFSKVYEALNAAFYPVPWDDLINRLSDINIQKGYFVFKNKQNETYVLGGLVVKTYSKLPECFTPDGWNWQGSAYTTCLDSVTDKSLDDRKLQLQHLLNELEEERPNLPTDDYETMYNTLRSMYSLISDVHKSFVRVQDWLIGTSICRIIHDGSEEKEDTDELLADSTQQEHTFEEVLAESDAANPLVPTLF